MELLEAIKSRKSIRAFKVDPVPKQTLMELLEIATRAPSGVNLQPWEFYIVMGKVLDKVRHANVEQFRQGIGPHSEIPMGAVRGMMPKLEGVYRDRQVQVAKQIYQLVGIGKEDKEKLQEWNEKMMRCYDAPAIIVIVVDKMLEINWPMLDIGLVAQTIALAAQEYGLGTCIMRAIVDYPEQVRSIVGIPESKRLIVGIAIGYPDWAHPATQLRTERENLSKIVTVIDN